MAEPHLYEIEIRGRASDRVLRPVIDEFRIEPTGVGTTRLVGPVCDPSHLHGLLAHFASLNVELIGVRLLERGNRQPSVRSQQAPKGDPT